MPPDRLAEFEAKLAEELARLRSDARRGGGARSESTLNDLGLAAAVEAFVAGRGQAGDRASAAERAETREGRTRQGHAGAGSAGSDSSATSIEQLEKAGPMALAPRAYAVRDGEPTDVKLQIGGDPRKLGDLVPRGVPRVLEPDGDDRPAR